MKRSFFHLLKDPPVKYGEAYPLFTRISIETTKTCTRSCWFCPSEQRGSIVQTMSDTLYNKILTELHDLNFQGVVQWFFLNEPLIDRNWYARIKALRQACPRVSIHLTTNWDTMHKATYDEQLSTVKRLFDAGVNSLNLNDYDARGYEQIVEHVVKELRIQKVEHCWKKLSPKKRVISNGPLPEQLHNWSGYVDDTKITNHNAKKQTGKRFCARPHRHIVVQYDGQVPLCCAVNPSNTSFFGNINMSSLIDVWNTYEMFKYRRMLQDGVRKNICDGCTSKMAFPNVVRKVEL
jgi:MoaA/NifB/PqqE/SkfB family radical SAM enzyme